MSVTVIYHADCLDGFAAAWVAWRQFKDEAKYIPMHYHEELPVADIDGQDVYVLDFSFKGDRMAQLLHHARRVVVMDHHASAKAELQSWLGKRRRGVEIVFDDAKAGCRIAWEYFNDEAPPHLIRYVEDRDLWTFAMKYTREITAALDIYPRDFRVWNMLAYEQGDLIHVRSIVPDGKVVMRHRKWVVDRIADAAWPMVVLGSRVWVANSPVFQSEVCAELLKRKRRSPFVGCYFLNGKLRHWSLRSRVGSDVDVGALACTAGGGGHKHAAGFEEALA